MLIVNQQDKGTKETPECFKNEHRPAMWPQPKTSSMYPQAYLVYPEIQILDASSTSDVAHQARIDNIMHYYKTLSTIGLQENYFYLLFRQHCMQSSHKRQASNSTKSVTSMRF